MKSIPVSPLLRKGKTFFCLSCLLLLSTYVEAVPGIISISFPINRSVIQRNNSNQANVYFAGQFQPLDGGTNCPSYDYYYQVERLNLASGLYNSTEVSWTQFYLQSSPAGLFYNNHTLPVGWYDLKIKATSGGVNGSQKAYATVRFGVGDVYIVAGQSNAQGIEFNDPQSLPQISNYDCVSVHNYNGNCKKDTDLFPTLEKLITSVNFKVGPNGHNAWAYAALGRLIAKDDFVPTAFFNTAAGGTSVKNWQESSTRIEGDPNNTGQTIHPNTMAQVCDGYLTTTPATQTSYYYGQPYIALKNVLKYYAKVFGVRAVLWHQGEADTGLGTTSSAYQNALQQVINKSRSDFGNSDLTWYVSRASYTNGNTSSSVIAAQNAIAGGSYVHNGPYTDDILIRIDNLHFWKTGLETVAARWRDAINSNPSQRFSPAGPPAALIVAPSPYYAQAPSGYAEYRWATNNRNSPISTAQSANVDARCFVKSYGGDWFITPYYISEFFCTGGFRIGVEEPHDVKPGYDFVISANPVVDQSLSTP